MQPNTVTPTTKQWTFLDSLAYNPQNKDYIHEFAEKLRTTKVLHYTNVPVLQTTDVHQKDAQLRDFYLKLSNGAGALMQRDEKFDTGEPTNEFWLDITYVEEKSKLTFRHSNTRQPLHTDGAYVGFQLDISFFFCLQYAEIGGATTFIDGDQVAYILNKYEPQLYSDLTTAEVLFDKGDNMHKKSKIIDFDAEGILLNWNSFRVSDKNTPEVKEMCLAFHEFLEKKVVEGGLLTPLYLKTGQAVFFHDMRLLHGRNAFYGSRSLMKGGINF